MHPNRLKYYRINILIAIIITIAGILYASICNGQTTLLNETITLNGGLRSQFGGISRTAKIIRLPYNTDYIIIRINMGTTQQLDMVSLAASVGAFVATDGLAIGSLVNGIKYVDGPGLVDMYVYGHQQCAQQFVNKVDVYCNSIYSTENSGGGMHYFAAPTNTLPYYLCFRNPQSYTATTFHIEVVAYSR